MYLLSVISVLREKKTFLPSNLDKKYLNLEVFNITHYIYIYIMQLGI